MNRTEPPGTATAIGVVCCDVAAVGRVKFPMEMLPELRRCPGPVSGPVFAANFLKNSDEQTVCGLAAVYHAIHDCGIDTATLGRWGVIAAPYKLGRSAMAQTLPRYREEGAWGMSPHLIPHRSLHCVSGAVSCALKMHGPNFGVGDGLAEALPLALSMLAQGGTGGMWLVLTTFDPELPPDGSGNPAAGTTCIGLALALAPAQTGWQGLRLQVAFEQPSGPRVERRTSLDLARFQTLLDAPVIGTRSAPLQDFGAAGRLTVSVDGREPAKRQDTKHVTPLLMPHASHPHYAMSAAVHGVEAKQ